MAGTLKVQQRLSGQQAADTATHAIDTRIQLFSLRPGSRSSDRPRFLDPRSVAILCPFLGSAQAASDENSDDGKSSFVGVPVLRGQIQANTCGNALSGCAPVFAFSPVEDNRPQVAPPQFRSSILPRSITNLPQDPSHIGQPPVTLSGNSTDRTV